MSSNDQTSMFRPCVRKRDRFGQPAAPEKDMPAPLKELVTYAFRSACFKEAGAMPASRALSARALFRRPPPPTCLYLHMHSHSRTRAHAHTRTRAHTHSLALCLLCVRLSHALVLSVCLSSPPPTPPALSLSEFQVVELTRVFRQVDGPFVEQLTKIRNGQVDTDVLRFFAPRQVAQTSSRVFPCA